MIPGYRHIALRSAWFYRKNLLYQFLIAALLTAVITGSLLTGRSVRRSLASISGSRLGNTGIMVTSGPRYFSTNLKKHFMGIDPAESESFLELQAYCQSLASQRTASNATILAIDSTFPGFHGKDFRFQKGTVAINRRLASILAAGVGDEIIIRLPALSDIPPDAPFAPEKGQGISFVRKVRAILEEDNGGNFSLSISQIPPANIFISRNDLSGTGIDGEKVNRIIFRKEAEGIENVNSILAAAIKPSDIGFSYRISRETGETELRSARVFIDAGMLKLIDSLIPGSRPVLTYLANRITGPGRKGTPYSFIAALPAESFPASAAEGIVAGSWLAEDTGIGKGDTVRIDWYAPDSLNSLTIRSINLPVEEVVGFSGIWSDSLLMPDFPGISGSESCSSWDAGIPIKMGEIRDKDEDYWNRYRGTPKAFISYELGKKLWGNNFGPATAIRFNPGLSPLAVDSILSGRIDPGIAGFRVSDIRKESEKAISGSVDFSTLFLSLGFFMIAAAILLLVLSASAYFESKEDQVKACFSLGFSPGKILRLFAAESALVAFAGSLTGTFTGYLVNILITRALNSVWIGAVQTDTLASYAGFGPMATGFLISFFVSMLIMMLRFRRYLKSLAARRKDDTHGEKGQKGYNYTVALFSLTALSLILSLLSARPEVYAFLSGVLLFISLVLLFRSFLLSYKREEGKVNPSRSFYSVNPAQALAPVMFIAAGIFAVVITGANRLDFSEAHKERSGGSGGYLLWGETTLPLVADLNTGRGKREAGIDEEELSDLHFVQAKKLAGDDASCLNLNHITAPPVLGLDPSVFIREGAFSFARALHTSDDRSPWELLEDEPAGNIIYGVADQTVLQWGLKLAVGDTIIMRSETGIPVKIVIAGGLKSSVFQGYLLIGISNFTKYFPSVAGSSVFLSEGNPGKADLYDSLLVERLGPYGPSVERTSDRLSSFYRVTNTYLSVFTVFGAFGLITGVAGLGFVLMRSYNRRKRELALMLASGFTPGMVRGILYREQLWILMAGLLTGLIPALIATWPSLSGSGAFPWGLLASMIAGIVFSGIAVLTLALRAVRTSSLAAALKKE